LVVWLTGDITNLLGCVLTQQLPVQLYTAIYFCFIDVIMVSQWVYYTKINPLEKSTAPLIQTHEITPRYLFIYFLVVINLLSFPILFRNMNPPELNNRNRELLQFPSLEPVNHTAANCELRALEALAPWVKIFGDVCAWVSALLYFFARVPQIYLNYKRRTVEGLSMLMFGMINVANIFYGTYMILLLKEFKEKFWISDFPFLLGSLGAVFTNTIILIQWGYYDHYLERRYGRDEEYSLKVNTKNKI